MPIVKATIMHQRCTWIARDNVRREIVAPRVFTIDRRCTIVCVVIDCRSRSRVWHPHWNTLRFVYFPQTNIVLQSQLYRSCTLHIQWDRHIAMRLPLSKSRIYLTNPTDRSIAHIHQNWNPKELKLCKFEMVHSRWSQPHKIPRE
jgi:hypothetical protein